MLKPFCIKCTNISYVPTRQNYESYTKLVLQSTNRNRSEVHGWDYARSNKLCLLFYDKQVGDVTTNLSRKRVALTL